MTPGKKCLETLKAVNAQKPLEVLIMAFKWCEYVLIFTVAEKKMIEH